MSHKSIIGSCVRIVTPKMFLRCGYPLTMDEVSIKFSDEIRERVARAAVAASIYEGDHRAHRYLDRAVCASIMRREGFGGKERKIFEQDVPEIAGASGLVDEVKMIQTGIYEKGWMSGDTWECGPEWNPPYLDKVKQHRVYTVNLDRGNFDAYYLRVRILAEHCDMVNR